LRVTVLGKSPSWQDAAGACSGYLAQEQGTSLLLDCGNGVLAKLRSVCDYVHVDAVVISHMHADHFLDLVPFSYALRYGPQSVPVAGWPGTATPARPRLYLPAGGGELLRRVVSCWGQDDLIDTAFAVHEYAPGDVLSVGSLAVRFCEVPHYVVTFAVELSGNRARFTYGADCRPNDQLVRFATDTDMLLIEATLPRPERDGTRGHLTAHEAGEHGLRAGARRVVLTHYSDELDPELIRAEGADGFGGPVDLAADGAVYTV
jgi:ribonuclease BN (tRNA processing enzyme)